MRTLSANALTQIQEQLGGEPIYIVKIQWVPDGTIYSYADRDIPSAGIDGRIMEAGTLDAVITSTSDSQEVSITLMDKDGAIKSIMDTNDIHKRDAWIYQWFEGLDISDAFLLFRGQINSPISWNERDRTVSFAILSQIEDKELGFSPEEGEFSFITDELIGRPWPLCFGNTVHSRTIKLSRPSIGVTANGVAMADPALPARIAALKTQISMFRNQEINQQAAGARVWTDWWFREYDPYYDGPLTEEEVQAKSDYYYALAAESNTSWKKRQDEVNQLQPLYNEQKATEFLNFKMFNSQFFPSGIVTIQIGDLKLGGYKSGEGANSYFNILSRWHPKIVADPNAMLPYCDGGYTSLGYSGGFSSYRGPDNGSGAWQAYPWIKGDNDWGYIYEPPGSEITLLTTDSQQYIVSIVPGTILSVSTKMQKGNQSFLVNLSPSEWTQFARPFGSITAEILAISRAKSSDPNVNFSDDLYVTFQSTVGPNTVDIMEWVINNYTEFAIDSTSFDHVKTLIANYPSNFSVYDRFNVMDFLQDVAWQARCSLRLVNGTFYLTYLPEVPTSVATITESDIDVDSFEIDHTPTENLTTKMVCNWYATGAQDKPNRVVMRHNVAKYGIQEATHEFFIYSKVDLVIKSATFWLIRNANTWKIARFTTPLNLLNVETQDGVTLNFSTPYISNGSIIALVEEASYDSSNQQIQFQCWTGVKAGQMEQYDFAYPADVDETLTFPTPEEIANGFDGGWGTNKEATGSVGDTAQDPEYHTFYTIGDSFDMGNRKYSDKGQPKPSDRGDSHPGTPYVEGTPILSVANPGPGSGDITRYTLETEDSELAIRPVDYEQSLAQIDLHSTPIYDSITEKTTYLASFFSKIDFAASKQVDGDNEPYLHARTDSIWSSVDQSDGREFLFQYDTDIESWGAGLAFLYEDEEA